MVKVIAMYLPQYHVIPENSRFWGEGYTDWKAVRKSVPLFAGHRQPRVPIDEKYYDLSRKEDIQWQADLAAKYGVYGFGIYHYWFSSKQNLLQKPAEIILQNPDINTHFFFCWDNSSWRRTWSNVKIGNDWAPLYEEKEREKDIEKGILAELIYGSEEDWEIHFEYLLDFFKDSRYIKIGRKPLFSILNQDNDTETLEKMCAYWDTLAKRNGFDGIAFMGKGKNNSLSFTEYTFHYQPEWEGWTWHNQFDRVVRKGKQLTKSIFGKSNIYHYDSIWRRIVNSAKRCANSKEFYCGFVAYDDSPRRGNNGKIVLGSSPDKFGKYVAKLLEISRQQNKEFLFLVAWNEWGEGAYLEPDTFDRYRYLDALKSAIDAQDN